MCTTLRRERTTKPQLEICNSRSIEDMKKADVVDQFETAALLALRKEEDTAVIKLFKVTSNVSLIDEMRFHNLLQTHGLGARKKLSVSITHFFRRSVQIMKGEANVWSKIGFVHIRRC